MNFAVVTTAGVDSLPVSEALTRNPSGQIRHADNLDMSRHLRDRWIDPHEFGDAGRLRLDVAQLELDARFADTTRDGSDHQKPDSVPPGE